MNTITSKIFFSLLTFSLLFPVKIFPQGINIEGSWQGALKVSSIQFRIVFNIISSDEGNYKATMDSPDQGAKDIPVDKVTLAGENLKIEMPAIRGEYNGLVNSEEVTYENTLAGNTLAGTFTFPKSGGPFPAVILITGSGAQNRNEELLGHKPFLVLSDYLTKLGIAVLRFDDRGVGKSTGDYKSATSKDFATDVLAGIEYLKTRIEVTKNEIGLIGHSEGGLIAPMVAVKSKDVAFIVLMAGPG